MKYMIICLCALFCTVQSIGQNQIQFKHLNVEQGLSNGSITDVIQDSIGFIWIATKNGLNRFDGSTFRIFNKENSGISSDDISALTIDSNGRFWIGTIGGGLNRYNPIKDRFTIFKNDVQNNNSISSDIIHVILEDSHGNIWIGTEMGLNLYVEETNSFKSFVHHNNKAQSISHNSVWSIFEQENGVMWVGTYGGGLNKFDKNSHKFLRFSSLIEYDKNSSFDFINSISEINQNELLVGTNGSGLVRLNLLKNSATNFFKNSKYENISIVRTVWKDKQQNFWIGTDGNGILKIKDLKDNKFTIDNYLNNNRLNTSLSNNTVNTIFEDNQSNIWIGTAWKGINTLEKQTNDIKVYYSDSKGYDSSPILSIFKNANNLWMGTDGEGLSIYNTITKKNKFYNEKNANSIGGKFIQCIIPNGSNQFWIGTFANGLLLFDPEKGKLKQYKRETNNSKSLPYNDVRDIIELPSRNLWVGTWGGGLSYFDFKKQEFKNFRNSNILNSISSDNILSLLKNEDGKLWIATYGCGLNLFDPTTEKFTHFLINENNNKSIGSNYVYDLIKDNKENLWLGTKEGINSFNIRTKEFKKYKVGNSINSNIVVGLIQDDEGFIWMSTKEGIFRYDPIKNKIEAFPEVDDEFHIKSIFKDKDGILYFGSAERVISFNPKISNLKNNNPSVIFTDFKLFNKNVDIGANEILKKQIYHENEIVLDYHQNVITFDFTALKFPFSKKEQFAIKMEGFEENWRDIGEQKSTTFTSLSPGEYTFKVKRLASSGEWIEDKIAKVDILILPPFWKTWWAYILYCIITVLLLLAYKRYTYRWVNIKNELKFEKLHREQEDKLHKLKQRFFTNISHEIRTPLTLISTPLNSLLKKGNFSASQQKQLSIIKISTNRLLNLVTELLNFRKLETGNVKLKVTENDIVEFVNEMFLSYSQHAIKKEIKYRFKTSQECISVWFDKAQLEKAIYNLLSNAFKFSSKGDRIDVAITLKEKYVIVSVKDTGIGIPMEKLQDIFERFYQNDNNDYENKGFGIGLSITKDIVELHSGFVHVKSKLNMGSEFSIKIPLGQNHFDKEELIIEEINDKNIENYSSIIVNPDTSDHAIEEVFTGSVILLIEDNTHIRKHLNELLSGTYVVYEASNGKEGLEKAIDIVPDLVISDIMMPVMDGVSFCRHLKSDIRISHIPVILLTARTLNSDKIEGYETGADDYVTKPFNEIILKIRIRNLLNSRKVLRERFINEGIIQPSEIALNSPDEEFLTKLVNIVEEHIEESEFNIDQLSKDMAMGHSNVYKKVKALTGMTIVGFVKDFRLKRASQYLKQNKMPIIDVCFKVGYTDRRHFSQEFKKKFGVSPSIYIKENSVE